MTSTDHITTVAARATARHAYHEAGHVVAAVARRGRLRRVYLGSTDWSTDDDSGDTHGGTIHRSAWKDQPFVTFAGPWAEAMWTVENDPDVDDLNEALDFAWIDNSEGDTDKYESRVKILSNAAVELGFNERIGRSWEFVWGDELADLWPVICEIAALLIDGQQVTHDIVVDAIVRCPNDE